MDYLKPPRVILKEPLKFQGAEFQIKSKLKNAFDDNLNNFFNNEIVKYLSDLLLMKKIYKIYKSYRITSYEKNF